MDSSSQPRPTVPGASALVESPAGERASAAELAGEKAVARADAEGAAEIRAGIGESVESYSPLAAVLAAAWIGAFLGKACAIAPTTWGLAALLAIVAWQLAHRWQAERVAALALLTGVCFLGGAWGSERWRYFDRDEIGLLVAEDGPSQPVCLEVLVLRPPRPARARDPHGPRMQLPVRVLSRRLPDFTWRRCRGLARLTIEGETGASATDEMQAGDRLRIFARLSAPPPPLNPGQLDYRAFQRRRRVLVQLRARSTDCVRRLARSWSLRRAFYSARQIARRRIAAHLRPARAAVATALLLGDRSQLSDAQRARFLNAGVMHLLAVSGLHVVALSCGVWLLGRLGLASRKTVLAAAGGLAVAYAVFTEAQPPVVRAAVFIVVACAARWLGRQAVGLNGIAAAGLIVLALYPVQSFEVGVQLSFLAVCVLSAFATWRARQPPPDPLTRLIRNTRPWAWRVAAGFARASGVALLAAAAVSTAALPLTSRTFHILPLLAPLLNVLLWPATAAALVSGLLLIVLGGVPGLGGVFGSLCEVALAFIEAVLDGAAAVPAATLQTAGPPAWWTVGFYLLLGFLFLVSARSWHPALWLGLGVWCLLGIAHAVLPRDGRFECIVLEMGHGGCTILRTPAGKTLVFDAGSLGSPASAARRIRGALQAGRIQRIDCLVLSHADADHYNGLLAEPLGIPIASVVLPARMRRSRLPTVRRLLARLERDGTRIGTASSGQRLLLDPTVRLTFLSPPAQGLPGGDNANSLVLSVVYGKHRLLLTGDLEDAGVEFFLRRPPERYDVITAPHHGSARSDPRRFLKHVRPGWVIVQEARRGDLAELRAAARQQGSRVLQTAEVGAVRLTVGPAGWRVQCWRSEPWQ